MPGPVITPPFGAMIRVTAASSLCGTPGTSSYESFKIEYLPGKSVPLLVVRANPEERRALLAIGRPYFPTRTGHDRIAVALTGDTDWEEIRELVTESYRIRAPKKLSALLDELPG